MFFVAASSYSDFCNHCDFNPLATKKQLDLAIKLTIFYLSSIFCKSASCLWITCSSHHFNVKHTRWSLSSINQLLHLFRWSSAFHNQVYLYLLYDASPEGLSHSVLSHKIWCALYWIEQKKKERQKLTFRQKQFYNGGPGGKYGYSLENSNEEYITIHHHYIPGSHQSRDENFRLIPSRKIPGSRDFAKIPSRKSRD